MIDYFSIIFKNFIFIMKKTVSQIVIEQIDKARNLGKISYNDIEISKSITDNQNKDLINKVRMGKQKFPEKYIDKLSALLSINRNVLLTGEILVSTQEDNPTLSYEYLLRENILLLRKLREYEQKEGVDLDKVIELKKKIDELTDLLNKKLG